MEYIGSKNIGGTIKIVHDTVTGKIGFGARLFSRATEWLLLGCLKLRGLEQVVIHACLSFTAMLAVALAAVRGHEPGLMKSIKHFTA